MASHSVSSTATPDTHGHDDGAVHVHIADSKFYWGIFGALIVLTGITVGASYVDLGAANTVVAVLIATAKASLVAAFFMHLSHDKLFNTICLVSAFAFLILFFTFTYEDTSHRNRVDEYYGAEVNPTTGEAAPGAMPRGVEPAVKKAMEAPKPHGGEAPAAGHAPAKAPAGGGH